MRHGPELTIVVIEEDDAYRDLISRSLWLAACHLLMFSNWDDAWDFYQNKFLDKEADVRLILCSGPLYRSRNHGPLPKISPHVPLLLLSPNNEDAEKTLLKPFDESQLLDAMSQFLDSGSLAVSFCKEKGEGRVRWFEVETPSAQSYLDRFQQHCSRLAGPHFLQQSKDEFKIAVQELGQNAIEWGHGFRENMRLKMAYRILEDRICIRICDQGHGFNHKNLPDTSDPIALIEAREVMGKRPGGFGVQLSRKVMDSIAYNDKGNMVILEKFFTN
jgi:anti-sigma regulatory factor (Ser/Thr protein kinase)